MQARVKRYRELAASSPLVKHNVIFFTGSMATAILNYLFYPILSRLLSVDDFGEVQAVMSLTMQFAVLLSILGIVTIHVTVNDKDADERRVRIASLERLALQVGLVLCLIAMALAWPLASFFNFRHVWPIIALIATIYISIPLGFRMSYLRGVKRFGQSSASDAIGSASKIVFSALLVAAGWRAFGAIVGIGLSQVLSLIFAVRWARRAGYRGFGIQKAQLQLNGLRKEIPFAVFALVISLCTSTLLSFDILAAKHYFSPQTAGLYAGVATIARIMYYASGSVTGVLMTHVSLSQTDAKNRRQLLGSMAMVLMMGIVALAVLSIAPEFAIKILVGSKYLPYAQYLPRIGMLMVMLSLVNLVLVYHMALRHYSYAGVAVVGLLFTFAAVSASHGSVASVVNAVIFGTTAMLVGILAWGSRTLIFRRP